MHLAAAVDTLALLQHGVNTLQDGSEVTHRGMLDNIEANTASVYRMDIASIIQSRYLTCLGVAPFLCGVSPEGF